MQASGQVGRAAALAEVVGDAAGEAQRGEGAAQTWGGHGALRAGASGRLRLGEGRGGVRGARGAGPRGNRALEEVKVPEELRGPKSRGFESGKEGFKKELEPQGKQSRVQGGRGGSP